MLRLAHISDVHLGPLPDISYRELASKRMVGYVNWQRNRRRLITGGTLGAIVAALKTDGPQHIAVTGDLVNLALDAEIELARVWLEMLGRPEDVSVVPGNHDAYVPGAFDKACVAWRPWMAGDDLEGPIGRKTFPYLRIRGNVAIIGVTSARATAPFMASGFFREEQSHRLAKILDETGSRGLCRVVMIHHPPVRSAVPQHKRLFGIARFHDTVRNHGCELVLHGHSHNPTLFWIGDRKKPIPVVGVAATGQGLGGSHAPAQYNLFEISGDPVGWRIRLTRRGITTSELVVSDIERLDLGSPARAPGVFEEA